MGGEGKNVQVMQRIQSKNANSDLVLPPDWERARGSCYCCSARPGEEQQPCQNCCSHASPGGSKVMATILLPRPQPPSPAAPASRELGGLEPCHSLPPNQSSGWRGNRDKARRAWMHRVGLQCQLTPMESQSLQQGHPLSQGKANSRGDEQPARRGSLAQQPLQQRRIPSFIIQDSQPHLHELRAQEPLTFCKKILSLSCSSAQQDGVRSAQFLSPTGTSGKIHPVLSISEGSSFLFAPKNRVIFRSHEKSSFQNFLEEKAFQVSKNPSDLTQDRS